MSEPAMSPRSGVSTEGLVNPSEKQNNILIIKHSALGDFILATAAMKAIREFHREDKITLLTTSPFAEMARSSNFFDEVVIDERPKCWQLLKLSRLSKILRLGGFQRIYDLQTSDRSSSYYNLFPVIGKPEWVGIVKMAKHYHKNPNRTKLHTLDRQADQLAVAGIISEKKPDISWLKSDIAKFNLPEKYALIIAGGAAHRPEKRWGVGAWAELCKFLQSKNITPVFIGTGVEKEAIENIIKCHAGENRYLDSGLCRNDNIINLVGKTSIADIAELARNAIIIIGNDTGPTHVAAATDAPFLVLFSTKNSNPDLCAPRGNGTVLQRPDLKDLPVEEVIEMVKTTIDSSGN